MKFAKCDKCKEEFVQQTEYETLCDECYETEAKENAERLAERDKT